jgi:hypothetical protein
MLRIASLFALAALMFTSSQAGTIVSDNQGNMVGLPRGGGNSSATITNMNSRVSTSPYLLNVYINNGVEMGQGPVEPNSKESFWFQAPNNNGRYGNASLVASGFSPNFQASTITWNTTAGQYLGTQALPTNITGLYQFKFIIPVLSSVLVNLTYTNVGSPQVEVDLISIMVTNPAVAVGDPQFIGLRGQSYQVHGIDGAVYNIISEARTQVNSRFVFLSEGKCPMVNGRLDINCWSHPGSYMGELSFQQIVDGKLHQVLLVAGPSDAGFTSVAFDGKKLFVGDALSYGTFSINMRSSHVVTVATESFSFQVSNSDNFINQAVTNLMPLSKLTSHGLLGQTHIAKIYPTATRYIEGEVDNYVIANNDIFGSDFAFNRFQL